MSGARIYWFTGLSGSGKTTLSREVAQRLADRGVRHCVLDGDVMRSGLCADLGFSPADRDENIRRAGEVARLMSEQGMLCLCAFITPMEAMRIRLRQRLGAAFRLIFVDCPLEECIRRDPKGNYRRVGAGEIKDYTGLGAPYEPPAAPDLHVDTAAHGVAECADAVLRDILCNGRQGE